MLVSIHRPSRAAPGAVTALALLLACGGEHRGAPPPEAADVLFVVDDSASMQSKQARLAQGFPAFVSGLARQQAERARDGRPPLDVRVAVTTSSVFEGWQPLVPTTCQATAGALQCAIEAPMAGIAPYSYACAPEGAACADLVDRYVLATSCDPGLARAGAPYPAGDFVAAPGSPAVVHLDATLAWETWGTSAPDPALAARVAQLQASVQPGTCGSGMEQHLEASRLALQKALAHAQPATAPGEWPRPGSVLAIVWVGDEDDCSSPKDPMKAVLFSLPNLPPGQDACAQDAASLPGLQKEFAVADYASYLTSLGHPLAAAFIYSAVSCRDYGVAGTVCDPGVCQCANDPDPLCGGLAPGTRLHQLSGALRSVGLSTVEASVCDDFGVTLARIAATL